MNYQDQFNELKNFLESLPYEEKNQHGFFSTTVKDDCIVFDISSSLMKRWKTVNDLIRPYNLLAKEWYPVGDVKIIVFCRPTEQ